MTSLVVTSSWPRTGDELAGTFVRSEALAMDGRVVVAAPAGPGVARGGANLDIHDVEHGGLFGSPGALERWRQNPLRAAGLLSFARDVAALVERARPSHVVAHWLVPCGAVVRACVRDADVTLVAHGADVRLLEAMPRAIASRVLASLTRGVRVRAVSEDLARRLCAIAPVERLFVSPMALADLSAARAEASALRDAHGAFAVVASRLVAAKQVERAFAHARGLKLVLVGDGPERAALVERARRERLDVLSTGALPHERALSWIAAAELVIAPLARGEGAPTVVREARALGRPVLVLDGAFPAS